MNKAPLDYKYQNYKTFNKVLLNSRDIEEVNKIRSALNAEIEHCKSFCHDQKTMLKIGDYFEPKEFSYDGPKLTYSEFMKDLNNSSKLHIARHNWEAVIAPTGQIYDIDVDEKEIRYKQVILINDLSSHSLTRVPEEEGIVISPGDNDTIVFKGDPKQRPIFIRKLKLRDQDELITRPNVQKANNLLMT
jgi:hypothetical protein